MYLCVCLHWMRIRPLVQRAAWVLSCATGCEGGGGAARAQVTTVKLSHMGCGGVALGGLVLPACSGCCYCWLSSADCTNSCKTLFLFFFPKCTSVHMSPSEHAHAACHMMLSKWNHSTSSEPGFKSTIGHHKGACDCERECMSFWASYWVTSRSTASRDRKLQTVSASASDQAVYPQLSSPDTQSHLPPLPFSLSSAAVVC